MRQRIDIRGAIIQNNYKDVYDHIGIDSTCPRDVRTVLDASGDDVDVYINSYGGDITPCSEIYTMLREASRTRDVMIHITGAAYSAASVIACSARSEMSPTALMMLHCVSSCVAGNHADLEHEAETLSTADQALVSAYTEKSGMTREEVLEMMENETWLTAERAKELGLIDDIMFAQPEPQKEAMVAGIGLLSAAAIERIRGIMQNQKQPDAQAIAQAQRLQIGRLATVRKQ